MDGLAAIVMNEFDLDPFSGAIFIFRSKRADLPCFFPVNR